MKQISLILILLAFIIGCFFGISIECTAFAEESEEVTEQNLDNVIQETLNGLSTAEYETFIATLEDGNGLTLRGLLNEILYGNSDYGFSYFFKLIISIFFSDFKSMISKLILIIVISILYGLLGRLTSDFMNKSTKKIVYIGCYGIILTILTVIIGDTIKTSTQTVLKLSEFVDISFPVLLTLIAALGGSASLTAYQPMVLILGTIIFKIINYIIFPLFYISTVFGLIGNVSSDLKLNKFAITSKKTAEWILGIIFGLFITFLTVQGITGATIDTVASKGVKFALSSYVPIIGAYLKDGFDIIVAGCLVLKNALGLCSVIVLLIVVLSPIIKLIVTVFSLKLIAAVIEPITDNKFADAVASVADSMKILIAILACLSFVLFIFIMLLICTCNMGVL